MMMMIMTMAAPAAVEIALLLVLLRSNFIFYSLARLSRITTYMETQGYAYRISTKLNLDPQCVRNFHIAYIGHPRSFF